ncbi:MAG: glycosyltransferase family 2 protein [Rhizobiaceae bacterium]|nr:glycosyltransferase family 2 protein [Rhizobiaceae bacterium]MCV0405589.1 glycosyltransferase family 2 protein [Rhizobiaceae bacterium]
MATMNGARFLDEQLRSIEAQTQPAVIDIWVSDDGSRDGTRDLLDGWARRWTRGGFTVLEGPGRGFAENFRSLILNAAINADAYAYCDQDDVWEPDKSARALAFLSSVGGDRPAMFCSRTLTMAESGEAVGVSRLFRREPSFRNALVQSIAGGNTMTINRAARDLVAQASARTAFVSHDWWTYLLVTGAGGAVSYCPDPLVRYRQHAGNQVGANASPRAMAARLHRLARGRFTDWMTLNIEGLRRNRDLLTPEAGDAFRAFEGIRSAGMLARANALRRAGVYRQSRAGTLALTLAALFGRL